MNLATQIHSQSLHDTIQALRYEAGLSKRIVAHLRGLERDLVAELAKAGDITTKRALKALLVEARSAIADRYKAAQGVFDDEIPQFAQAQAGNWTDAMNGLVKVDIFRMSMTADQARAIASEALIEGAPSADWWAAQEADTLFKFKNAVRTGMLEGQTGDQMARTVRDLMQTRMRNAQALVRTSVITVNNAAHMACFEANADIVKGVQWVATLDPRTCLVAGTPVATPSGTGPIECLSLGDMVIGGSGKPRRVIGVSNRRAKRLVKITLSNGKTIKCTEDHLWLNSDQEWVEAKDLKYGDALASALK